MSSRSELKWHVFVAAGIALARMRSYEEQNITSPSRSIVVEARSMNHD